MKKIIIVCLISSMFTGCFQNTKNRISKTGGLFSTESANYIIVNTAGNRILDIYKLEDTYVSENRNTDGVNFRLDNGTHITIQGDVKIIRNPSKYLWDKYSEYHFDENFENVVLSNDFKNNK